jgi:hypothetical protein
MLFVPVYSIAQDLNPTTHEIGLNLSGPHTFGVRYRTGSEDKLLRLTLLSIEGSNLKNTSSTGVSKNGFAGAGFNIGIEKRKPVADNLNFYLGPELLTSYTFNTDKFGTQKTVTWNISAGIGLVLGFVYKINSYIDISAEFLPSINYSLGRSNLNNGGIKSTQKNTGITYGLSDTGANLTLSFRLGKK